LPPKSRNSPPPSFSSEIKKYLDTISWSKGGKAEQ
jgi:hypothetical protein